MRPWNCESCKTRIGWINDKGELLLRTVRLAVGTWIYCRACGHRIEITYLYD